MTIKITKQLATVEDLAIGTGTVVQERNGVPLTLTKIDLITASKLASENAGEGAALVSMEGGPSVEVAVLAVLDRVIRVTSIAAMEAYSAPVGYVFSLNAGGRSGTFDVVAGDFSTELTADTLNGIYVGLADNATGTTKVAKRRDAGFLTAEMFGALFNGSDDSAAWNALATNMPAGSIISSTTPGGTSRCNSTVTFNKDVIFSCPGITVNMTAGDFNITGAIETLTATLSSNAEKANLTISVSDGTQFSAGDEIIIQNAVDFSFSLHRSVYQDGEFLTVLSVSGNDVTFETGLISTYLSAGSIEFHKVTPVKVKIKGINFIGQASANLVELDLVRDFYLESIDVKGGTYRALSIRRCYGGRIVGGNYFHNEPATSTNYGISIANSQGLEIIPESAFGTRHGVATGGYAGAGAVPCRNINIRTAAISSTDSHGADIHGNAENVYYIDCNISNGTGIGGKNCGVIGGTVSTPSGYGQPGLMWVEVAGGTIAFKRIDMNMPSNSLFPAFAPNSSTVLAKVAEDVLYVLDDISVIIPPTNTSDRIGSISNSANGNLSNVSASITNIRISGDQSSLTRVINTSISNPLSHPVAPVKCKKLIIDNIIVDYNFIDNWFIDSGNFVNTGSLVTLQKVSGFANLTVSASGYQSSAFVFRFPGYKVAPVIILASTGSTIGGGTYVIPLCNASTNATASIILTTMHSSEAVSIDRTQRVDVTAGFDNFVWP